MPAFGIKLVDSNLWLALAFGDHAHHRAASVWFQSCADGEAAFCRITQMAFLRHLTNEKLMGRFVLSQRQAWDRYDRLCEDDRVVFLEEPDGLEVSWRAFTHSTDPRHRLWTDAYLAAFAIAKDIRLATIDRGFSAFPGLRFELVKPVET